MDAREEAALVNLVDQTDHFTVRAVHAVRGAREDVALHALVLAAAVMPDSRRDSVAVAALGVTTMPTLSLTMLARALIAADGAPQPKIVEVAEWTSMQDVNAALLTGRAVLFAAGIRDGTPFYVVGRVLKPKADTAT